MAHIRRYLGIMLLFCSNVKQNSCSHMLLTDFVTNQVAGCYFHPLDIWLAEKLLAGRMVDWLTEVWDLNKKETRAVANKYKRTH